MSWILRMLPVLAVGYFCYTRGIAVKEITAVVRQLRLQAVAEAEVRDILREVRREYLRANRVPVEDFAQFVRAHMTPPEGARQRDMALDPWRTPYRVERRGTRCVVLSAGKDRRWGTPDDIERFFLIINA